MAHNFIELYKPLHHNKTVMHEGEFFFFLLSLCTCYIMTLCDLMDCSPQALLSMGVSRQEYWSELPCLSPGDLLDPGIKPASLMFPALVGGFFTSSAKWETPIKII